MKNLKKYKTHYLNGNTKEEGSYYIDQIGFDDIEEFQVPVGEWRGWYEDGKNEYIEQFNKKGENDGIFIYWNKDGIKTREWYYKNGQKDGTFKIWYDDGKKSKETIFKKGKKDGFACEWYQNGKPKLETTFKDGLKNGTHIEWDESGEKVIEGKFKKGVLISKTPLGRSS